MKGKLIFVLILLPIFGGFFFADELVVQSEFSCKPIQEIKDIKFDLSNKVNHSIIFVECDDDFGPSGYNFPGTGTANDPYLIENLYIDTFNISWSAISIIDVTKSFTIRNCIIHSYNYMAGILYYSESVSHSQKVTITDNYVFTNGTSDFDIPDGIHLSNTNNLTISNNTISGKHLTGIYVGESSDVQIYNNTVEAFGDACKLNTINSIDVKNNHFSTINVHFNYTFYRRGISNSHSTQCSIYNNTFTNCLTCYASYSVKEAYVTNNTFNVLDRGVYICVNSRSNYIYQNWFFGNENTTSEPLAIDVLGVNHFYNSTLKLGNYWSNWNNWGRYKIGNVQSGFYTNSKATYDKYPLTIELLQAKKYPNWL